MEDKKSTDLYNARDLATMRFADEARMPGKNRIEEIKNFALKAGIKRIGIANCVAFQKEAELVKNKLADDFEIFLADCKYGKLPNTEILGADAKGISCNPSGQAAYLDENKTELNISMGHCVGHDMVFNQKSNAPVSVLLIKDRQHKHNPMETFKKNE